MEDKELLAQIQTKVQELNALFEQAKESETKFDVSVSAMNWGRGNIPHVIVKAYREAGSLVD